MDVVHIGVHVLVVQGVVVVVQTQVLDGVQDDVQDVQTGVVASVVHTELVAH